MHELSIATHIVAVAQEEATARGVEVEAVHLRLGALSGVVVDSLLFGFEIASQGTPLEGTRLLIEEVPLTIYCPTCEAEVELAGIQSLRCPRCGELSGEIRRGKELEIVALEVKD
ncbi:hydrogenase maturation nickel metallochaperone HypA [Meiothermus sp. CFH 77666]|uniref:hydrogenase maturation nickel metallochaperone HypA n=1 Tax=Meiothermus sp. CFH 77666 TaxID=2817942 RepID=UPI001AA0240F|nr:hydrogenase maturation nickel metallochaperone HypA [Meiothermus sp. CFH 77666]MBO1436207.1 hydrogenase maturation nickel metallochaperone HypA [Meiothermus sp. CFH 77666]